MRFMALMQSERVPERPGIVKPVSSERMGRDAAVRLGHFVLEGAFEARFDLFGVVVAQEAGGDDQAGHVDEAA